MRSSADSETYNVQHGIQNKEQGVAATFLSFSHTRITVGTMSQVVIQYDLLFPVALQK